MDTFQLFSNAHGSPAKPRAPRHTTMWAFIVAASLASPALMAANGDLDPSFSGGAFDIPIGSNVDFARSLTFQDDGRVLMGGLNGTGASDANWALLRRNTNGTLDSSFGGGTGQVITHVGGRIGNSFDSSISGVVVQSDGKILGVGFGLDKTNAYYNFHLKRWNTDGTPDATFGSYGNGGVTTFISTTSAEALGVALQQDRKLVVAGFQYGATGSDPAQPIVARYLPDGRLDSSFGTGGIFRLPGAVPAANMGPAFCVTIQPDGKIVFGSWAEGDTANRYPELLRLNTNGTLDGSFGTGGIATIPLHSTLFDAVAIQPDGKIVAAGEGSVVRFDNHGGIDTSFNGQGWIDVNMSAIFGMVLLPTGQIVVSGVDANDNTKLGVARITVGGVLDTSFTNGKGQSGFVETASPGGGYVEIRAVQLQPDGRFIISGRDTNHFVVARYLGDALDLLPRTEAFTSATGVPLSTVQVSNVITISGLTTGAWVPIQVFGGSYSINGDPFTSTMGYVHDGDQVMVDHTSAATHGTSVTTTLRVGGLSAPNSPWILHGSKVIATFTSTTK